GEWTLITDGRFMVQARKEAAGVRVRQMEASLFESVGKSLRELHARRVGFDATLLTVSQLQTARRATGSSVRWVPVSGIAEALRMKKDAGELAQMRKAAILAGEIVEYGIGLLKPGVRESEVAAEIEYQIRRRGASGPSFETIVAFGERGALPHARPTG